MSYEACAARDRGGQRRRQDDLRRRDHAAARPDQVATVCTDDYHRYDRVQRKELDITPLDPACNYLDVLAQHLRLLGAGRELSVEGPEILRRAAMGSPELGAALDVWRETTFDFEAVDHLDRSEARS